MIKRPVTLALALLAAACWGQTVTPLSPRDLTLSNDTRRWIADAEDGVIVARANRDATALHLEQEEDWVDGLRADVRWRGANAPQRPFEAWLAAREDLAEKELDAANAGLELAEAKYTQITAERAVMQDRAAYELAPIRAATDTARRRVARADEAVRRQRQRVEEKTTAWWQAFAGYIAAGGSAEPLWLRRLERVEVTERAGT